MHIYIVIGLAFFSCVAADAPVVEVTSGRVAGTAVEFIHPDVVIQRTVDVFRGIPYAEPPVGELRFQPPKSKTAWEGVYNATEFRPTCIQPMYSLQPGSEPQSEDCLFLNVYAPQTEAQIRISACDGVDSRRRIPRWVWFIVRQLSAIGNVIVVTINYRLGALGFFLTGDEHATGNYGLLDQIAALEWVQDNIAAFGGDANTVTISGQSAGSISADLLLFSPLAEGLFHRAIMKSGTATIPTFPIMDKALQSKIAHGLGKVLGCEKKHRRNLSSVSVPCKPKTSMIQATQLRI
ncbi:carboxylesterase 4A-like [Ptychodera flava]|uniref:carboxylesterase 4A-like n=1 Tax=Ptychodera flava TaxID=63121 RepID=UPI00396A5C21